MRSDMTAHEYRAGLDAYWSLDETASVGPCEGCSTTDQKRMPVCRDDGMVWMICRRCHTHDHLRACRVCERALPVKTAQVVDRDGGWNYCPEHAPESLARGVLKLLVLTAVCTALLWGASMFITTQDMAALAFPAPVTPQAAPEGCRWVGPMYATTGSGRVWSSAECGIVIEDPKTIPLDCSRAYLAMGECARGF